MSEETTTPPGEATTPTPDEGKTHEETVAYERFQKVNQKAKAEAERAKTLERELSDIRAQLEERESAGLPELERMKKEMERIQKRAEEAEAKATEADSMLARSRKERWVTAAAAAQSFADPSDAAAFLKLDDIEDEKDAERAVKRLAGQKKHLLKSEEPQIPGRVLQNGQATSPTKPGGINPTEEAQMLADNLKSFLKKREGTAI